MTNDWLNDVRARLQGAGFVVEENVESKSGRFALVCRRTRFSLTKFGMSETFFVFSRFDRLTNASLRAFSADAFRCALDRRKVRLPRGIFESVWCYAVAVAKEADPATLDAVRAEKPAKHWASAEIPVVRDEGAGRLVYFEKTPLWGAAYYAGFRREIRKLLE